MVATPVNSFAPKFGSAGSSVVTAPKSAPTYMLTVATPMSRLPPTSCPRDHPRLIEPQRIATTAITTVRMRIREPIVVECGLTIYRYLPYSCRRQRKIGLKSVPHCALLNQNQKINRNLLHTIPSVNSVSTKWTRAFEIAYDSEHDGRSHSTSPILE